MTKFEEVAKDIAIKRGYDSFHGLIADQEEANEIIEEFKNWHSDEDFQELFDKYSNLNNNYEKEVIKSSKLESQIIGLKSQLQQQDLPVVKDFVAEWYEENKKDLDFAIFDFCVELDELDKTSTEFEDWFDNSLNHPIETLIRMKDGYTIEKPQLFLLKHIDMSNSDKNYDKYLFKDVYGRLQHDTYAKGKQPTDHTCKFTQKEIDTMNIGSYEQIEVKNE